MQVNEFRADDLYGQIEGLVAQLEAERQARAAAEAANAGTLGLLDVVSKKLRPPMESVTALTDRILDGPLNLAQRRDAETLSHSMHRILSALTEVLDFSTLQSGEADFSVEPFDFHALVRETASALQACAAAKGLTSSVDMASNCPRYIVGDAMRVRQVLMALMETSIKATAEGSIRLYVSVNDAASPVTVRFDITDTSPGMTPEQQARLFQPSTDMSRSDGGLGLPIAQRIAEAMGGEVSCDSALGQGALYWFTFKALVSEQETAKRSSQPAPADMLELDEVDVVDADVIAFEQPLTGSLAAERAMAEMLETPVPEPEPLPEPEPMPEPEPKPEQVPARSARRKPEQKRDHAGSLAGHALMIEDNTVNRLLIGAYLDEFGLTFDVAETGAAALMCLAQRSYDVVLMDTVLPDYRGLQLAQRIRSQESVSAHVPIVALATLSDTEDEKSYVEAGVNASVDKPIQGLDLYAALVPLVPAKQEDADEEDWTPVY
ncbi:ATP-binding protein [Methyloceanibacter caenitepidi]|uniref:histidine kinase n=1 Tax=Methyloceanibacter caenitepidi TaxID=1384459 RepID=A0A0A8K744_9HYPH|nr:ATP-binding protein [Methyloceanibacter caenitepidi]BAQ18763.1 signal transduction histidine kinase [Methyloceanibacter caenitepidi]